MSDIRILNNLLSRTGGTMTGDLVLASGVNIVPEVSNASSLGDPLHPFSTIYADIIVGSGSTTRAANVVYVKKNPGSGEFSSIYDAVASISGADPDTNPYMVSVAPGLYLEPEITVGAGINIVGMDESSVIIQPTGSNSVLNMQTLSSASFLTIKDAPNGYYGAVVNDPGDFVLFHKVAFDNCDTAIIASASGTSNNQLYLEYVDATQNASNSTAFIFTAPSGSSMSVECENFYVYADGSNPPIGVLANGQGLTLRTRASALLGEDGTGTGLLVLGGATITLPVLGFSGWNTAISAPNDGNPTGPNIRLFSVSFTDNNINLFIQHPTATGFLVTPSPYSLNQINVNNTFYLVNQNPKIITVGAKGSDFTNVKDAVQAIVGESISNQFLISVGPETTIEDNPITLRPYISIEGVNPTSSTIQASNPNSPLFVGAHDSNLFNLTLQGTTGAYLIDWTNDNAFSAPGYMTMQNCYIGPSYGIANVHPQVDVSTYLVCIGIKSLPYSAMTRAFNLEAYSAGFTSGNIGAIHIQNSLFSAIVPPATYEFAVASGNSTTLQLDDVIVQSLYPSSGSTAITFMDGAAARLFSTTFGGFDCAISGSNIGDPSRLIGNALTILTCNNDIYLDHPTTSGTIAGTFSRVKTSISSPNVVNLSNDPLNFATVSVGDFYAGPSQADLTEITSLWIQAPTMGLLSTNDPITQLPPASGLNIRINDGYGYIDDGNLKKLTWSTQTLPLSANDDVYIYINSAGNVATTVSPINGQTDKILLGRAYCGPAFVVGVGNISMEAHHNGNKVDEYLRDVFGSIVADGMLITASGLQMNMSGGEYYYSSHKWEPADKEPIASFYQFYHSSGTLTSSNNSSGIVNNGMFDNGVNLTGLTAGYYTKHGMWYAGTSDSMLFVFGQNEYASLTGVQASSTPNAPAAFRDAIVHLADIIVQQGSGSIIEMVDTRPLPSYKAPSTVGQSAGVTVHNQLLGLGSDDHTQYLLVNGSRNMGATLNMGGYDITNVGLVGGIVPSGHAGGHLPNGIDPITTAAPTTNLNASSTNAVGIQNSLSRSDHSHAFDLSAPVAISPLSNSSGVSVSFVRADHVHAHGALTGTTLHNVASDTTNGFMSISNFVELTGNTANLAFVSGIFVHKTGDTMSGALTMSGASALNVQNIVHNGNGNGIQINTQATYGSIEIYAGRQAYIQTTGVNQGITLESLNGPMDIRILDNNGLSASRDINIENGTLGDINITSQNGAGNVILDAPTSVSLYSTSNLIEVDSSQNRINIESPGGYIRVRGDVRPSITNTYDLGGTGSYFNTLYANVVSGNTIFQSGVQVLTTGIGLGHTTVTVNAGVITISGTDVPTLITGTLPILVTGSTIGIGVASASTDGYLTSADWNIFAAGAVDVEAVNGITGNVFISGVGNVGVSVSGQVITITGTATPQILITGTAPILVTGSTIGIGIASASTDGYLTTSDWNRFNTSSTGSFVHITGDALTGGLNGTSANFSTITGTTISGNSLLGQTSNIGVITSNVINGAGITGTTVSGTSGLFQTAWAGVLTSNVGNFGGVTGTTVSGTSGLFQTSNIGVVTSNVGNFGGITGTTVSGTSGLFQTAWAGVLTSNVVNSNGITGTTISGISVFAQNIVASEITGTNVSGTNSQFQTQVVSSGITIGSGISFINSGTSNIGSVESSAKVLFVNEISGLNARGFVSAYSTGVQAVTTANTFKDITFGTNISIDGFTHAATGTLFTGLITGFYNINYSAMINRSGGATTNAEVRVLLDGSEIRGSQRGIPLTANNAPTEISNSFIVGITGNSAIKMQFTAGTTHVQLSGVGNNASARPTINLSINRIY